jgi:hypothetical protein
LDFLYEHPKSQSKYNFDWDIDRLTGSDAKAARGFNHVDTADLLCPFRLKEKFEEDPM